VCVCVCYMQETMAAAVAAVITTHSVTLQAGYSETTHTTGLNHSLLIKLCPNNGQ